MVNSRWHLWHENQTQERQIITGLRTDRREVLVTTVLDAEPQTVVILPDPSIWPFLLALAVAVGFIGVIFHPIAFVIGFFLSFFMIVGWLWPKRPWQED